MQPRHTHANERFYIEATFESPLPPGAIPVAEFAGPIGPGGPALTFWTSSTGPAELPDPRSVRLIGKVPAEAPPGLYRVTHLEVRWAAEMPLSWVPAVVPHDVLGADILIEVDEPLGTTQPPIPRLVAAG